MQINFRAGIICVAAKINLQRTRQVEEICALRKKTLKAASRETSEVFDEYLANGGRFPIQSYRKAP
jgi:hypothetical protein